MAQVVARDHPGRQRRGAGALRQAHVEVVAHAVGRLHRRWGVGSPFALRVSAGRRRGGRRRAQQRSGRQQCGQQWRWGPLLQGCKRAEAMNNAALVARGEGAGRRRCGPHGHAMAIFFGEAALRVQPHT